MYISIPYVVYLELGMGLPFKFFPYDFNLIALMWAQIPPGPDNFKTVLNTRLSRLHFMVDLTQWQTLHSRLRLILGRDPMKVLRL